MKNRPWIWVIVAHVIIITVATSVIIISRRYASPEVPIQK